MRIRDKVFAEGSKPRNALRLINRIIHIFAPKNLKKIYKYRKEKGIRVTLIEIKNTVFDGIIAPKGARAED